MSQKEGLEKVEKALGGRHPAYLNRLDAHQLRLLAELIENARRHEQQTLSKAINDAMDTVPALLRRPLKKILFP